MIIASLLISISCSTSKNNLSTKKDLLIYKLIQEPKDSITDGGKVNLYRALIFIQGNNLRYTIGKGNECTKFNVEIDIKTKYTLKGDSIFFKLNRKYENGLVTVFKMNGTITNDSLILNKYIRDDYDDKYEYIEIKKFKRCN